MSGNRKKPDKSLSPETVAAIRSQVIYGVGYGKPPEETQFKPGQSGNPKGRPRARRSADPSFAQQPTLATVLKAGRKPIRVLEGDSVTEVSSIEAVVQSITVAAIKGNARAQALALDMTLRAEAAQAREIEERNEFWSAYKAKASATMARAEANGEAMADLLPHPDDIIIDRLNGPHIIGPVDEAEARHVKEAIALCETLLMQEALDRRSERRLGGQPMPEPGAALLLFDLLQRAIPPRLRHSDSAVIVKLMGYEGWSKRRLLKELHQAWGQMGHAVPRGWVMPNLSAVERHLAFLTDLITEFKMGRIDPDAMAQGKFGDEVKFMPERNGIG